MSASVDPLQASKVAINHVLCRIRDEQQLQVLMGAGTESFDLLTKAAAILWMKPAAEIQERFIPGSSVLHAGLEREGL